MLYLEQRKERILRTFSLFPCLELQEAVAAIRKSAQDVQKFMDAVSKKTSAQDAQKGRCGRNRHGLALTCTLRLLICFLTKRRAALSLLEGPIRSC